MGHPNKARLAPSLGPFSFGDGMDDEDWFEKYREEFQKRASQKEMEERTQWQRTRYVTIDVGVGRACGERATLVTRLFYSKPATAHCRELHQAHERGRPELQRH